MAAEMAGASLEPTVAAATETEMVAVRAAGRARMAVRAAVTAAAAKAAAAAAAGMVVVMGVVAMEVATVEVVAKAVVVWAEAGRAVAAMGPEAKEEEDKGGRLNRLLAARLDAFEPRSGGGEGHGGWPVRNKPRKSRRTLERPARVLGREFACLEVRRL